MIDLLIFITTLPFTIGMFVLKYGLSFVFWYILGSYLWSVISEFDFTKLLPKKKTKFEQEKPEDYIL